MSFQISRGKRPISEINMTPFVDIVLVLLVIFMITAPLTYSNMKLKLPKTKKVERLIPGSTQVILSIDSSGDYYVGRNLILPEELIPHLKEKLKQSKTEIIYIRAHTNLPYGKVAKLMSFLRVRGINHIALITEIEEKK